MGLGKTLTMLSAIVCSKEYANDFSSADEVGAAATQSAASTLVVLPSRRKRWPSYGAARRRKQRDLRLTISLEVLDVWDSEIKR